MDKFDSVKEVFNLLEKELKDNYQPRRARVRTYRVMWHCHEVFKRERDGMMLALRVIDQGKYEEMYGNENQD